MANHLWSSSSKIYIPEIVNEESITYYVIIVEIEEVRWEVKRRYNEFLSLHEKLVEVGVDKEGLPPKKLLGNKDPAFLIKRRKELETYLQSTFHFLEKNVPTVLADFLHFDKYESHFILRNLASEIYARELELSNLVISGDTVDCVTEKKEECTKWTPLEMNSISQRLQHSCPPTDTESKQYDFTNIVDACCGMKELELTGSVESLGTSNIIYNQLKYDFLAFKSLSRLTVVTVQFNDEHITSLGLLRSTLCELIVHNCGIISVANVLLCDNPRYTLDTQIISLPNVKWEKLVLLDISCNALESLDSSIRLAPALETLVLNNNKIDNLEHLTGLPRLRKLDLSNNCIDISKELHTVLGQITHIDLSHNKIRSLTNFKKLYSLQDLNVSHNQIGKLEDVFHICTLPCLENIDLRNNNVTRVVDYRLKILEKFGQRSREICLDTESATQQELDKVSVLMALRVTREKKSPTSLFGNLPNSEQWKT
jgi:hypothetical protein